MNVPRGVWRTYVLAFTCALLLATPAAAQFNRGTISGTVKDTQGAVVPGVTVTVTNTETQEVRSVVTDASGFYTFPNLAPGRYEVSTELTGFKKAIRRNVQLDATGALTIDLSIEPGAISESVTVTAEATPLQTDVAVRKTVEAKDIELMSFSGRNPMGVPALKPGVIGGNFNNVGFAAFSNGGFSINGSRADENTISVDGAVAIRTRSAGTIIGIQNVDAVQEVQVLTANYLPEYGRASGGQIRFVTKSGSNRFSGNAVYYLRDDKLQANTWGRNRSPNASENSGPAPFNYKQYGYSIGGPIKKDKMFFFGAQEWVNFFQVATNTATVPTALMRQGDFSELLGPNPFFSSVQIIKDPLTGQPFPGNRIPQGQLSPNGIALMNLYPLPTPGFQLGTSNLIMNSDNPQNQRKDNFRIDYRITQGNQLTARYSRQVWTAIDAFRGTFPFARTDWNRPNWTSNFNWTSTITNNLINEASYAYSKDQVFINVFTGSGLQKRSRTGVNYPYIFPGKEIEDKIPTINMNNFSQIDGGPYPSSSQGPIHTWTDTATYVRGRHTIKGGAFIEYSGEDDFDQINVNSIPGGTNNQNGQFTFSNGASSRSGLGVADMALGYFSSYAEIGQRAFTRWRSLASDFFVQDSWKPRSNMTIEGGVRYVLWPPWHSLTNNIANFEPQYYDTNNQAVINPANGRIIAGPRYNGIVLPGNGFVGDGNNLVVAQNPAVQALFRGVPRGFSQTHKNVFEPRLGMSYSLNDKTILRASTGVFHNRVTLNDSTLLGGNPPFQPMVVVANGFVDDPGGVGGASNLPFSMQAQDLVFNHPTAYMWSTGVQREVPGGIVMDVTYVGRRGLYLQRERNINQLPEGTLRLTQNAGVNVAALRPFKGYGGLRMSENAGNSKYNSLQISGERRYQNGFKLSVAYTLSKSMDNASDKRDVIWNTYNDTSYWGPSGFDRRHVLVVSYIYDLPFWRQPTNLFQNILGGWEISGATFMRSGTPFSITRSNDIAGVGDSFPEPVDLVGDPNANANRKFSTGSDSNYIFNPQAFANPADGHFGNETRNILRNPGDQEWDIAIFKNFSIRGTQKIQFRTEIFNFPNHPNLSGPNGDITSPNFGRSISKSGDRRDIQLALRYLF